MSAATAPIEHPDLRPVRHDERRQAFALLWRAARPDRRQLALASALMLAAGGLEALGPIFGKLFIDEYLLPRRLEWLPVALLVAGIVVSGGVASALRYFQLVRLAAVAMRSVRRLRESVYNHVLRLPMAFFDRAITGQLVSRITNDTEQIRQLYVQVLFEMLQGVTVLIGASSRWHGLTAPDADRADLDSGNGGDRDRLPAPFGACGDALAGITQRH
jgi:ATP-binding cassette subfamily B protein/ATP-binding cassette subfamily C protein/ATP-binding cassette subfamily B multidrug efflux pump